MSLTPLSSSSSPSEKTSAAKSKLKRQAGKDLDLPIKLQVAAALAASGYYTRINVLLSATSSRGLSDVTDIDVLAIRFDVMFKREAIAVSCKGGTSKTLSAAREAFYLRGVLDYVEAAEGVAAFAHKSVAPHIRDLGQRLGILMLSGDEIGNWCKHLTNGVPDPGFFGDAAYDTLIKSWERVGSEGLAAYLETDYWFHFDFRNLQNLIVHVKKISSKLNGKEVWQSVIAWDTAAHLCLTVFDLCRQVRMLGLSSITDTTAAYLFGGAVSLKARRDLYGRVQQLLESTGVAGQGGTSLPPLEPVYSQALAELALRFIERPHAAILIPQIIQENLWRALGAPGTSTPEDKNYLAAEKLTQDLLDFLKAATGAGWMPKL